MKKRYLSWLLAGLMLGTVLPVTGQEAKSSEKWGRVESWKKPADLRDKLVQELLKRVKGLERDDMKAFVNNESDYRLLLTYHLACACNDAMGASEQFNNRLDNSVRDVQNRIANLEKEVASKKGPEQKREIGRAHV